MMSDSEGTVAILCSSGVPIDLAMRWVAEDFDGVSWVEAVNVFCSISEQDGDSIDRVILGLKAFCATVINEGLLHCDTNLIDNLVDVVINIVSEGYVVGGEGLSSLEKVWHQRLVSVLNNYAPEKLSTIV
jgi:hypothetical protein